MEGACPVAMGTKILTNLNMSSIQVPPGFEHLLEGLAREVLREQPQNIIVFAADYFRQKLSLRDSKIKLSLRDTDTTLSDYWFLC